MRCSVSKIELSVSVSLPLRVVLDLSVVDVDIRKISAKLQLSMVVKVPENGPDVLGLCRVSTPLTLSNVADELD